MIGGHERLVVMSACALAPPTILSAFGHMYSLFSITESGHGWNVSELLYHRERKAAMARRARHDKRHKKDEV